MAKIDPATLAIVDVIPVGSGTFAGPNWMSAGAGSIWTDVPYDRRRPRVTELR